MTVCRVTPRAGWRGPAARLALLALAATLPLLAAGCSKSPEKNVIATVGPRSVTQSYYESRLAKLKESDLPRTPAGSAIDTATREGKLAFLEVIINKELMALKAEELGLGADEQIVNAAKAITEYNAPTVLHADLIEKPADTVTDAELADYYQNLQSKRRLSFIICNFRDDAAKAREAIVSGKPWEDVADEFNDGSRGPTGDYKMEVRWGRLEDAFERAIWALKEGEISQPVETVYGFWILRLDAIEPDQVQPLEGAFKERVLDSIRARKVNLGRRAFFEESHRKHDFKMDENALWIIYQGLPEGEQMIDPATNKPTPREQLAPLNIKTEDLDKFFYQVRLDGKLETWTIGDYKQLYDKSNVFERPKRNEMLGGLRTNLMGLIDRKLMLSEARERGYMDDPRVTGDTREKREQMMVTRLHDQVIKVDEHVSPEELQGFWNEHKAEYDMPETRFGKVVLCASQEAAEKARADAAAGMAWIELLTRYSSNPDNKQNRGNLGPVIAAAASPLAKPLFALQAKGDLSPPVKIESSLWAIVRFDSTTIARSRELVEVSAEIGQRIKMRREEEKLQSLLVEWRQQFPVRIHEERLDKARSWAELAALPQAPDPLKRPQVR